jgi:hypothetical protein
VQVKHTELKSQEGRVRVSLAEAQAEASQLEAQLRAAVRRTQIAEQERETSVSASPSAALGEAYAQVSQMEDALSRENVVTEGLHARIAVRFQPHANVSCW